MTLVSVVLAALRERFAGASPTPLLDAEILVAHVLGTSRAALNRVLDPANTSLTLATLTRTAAALGCKVKVEIVMPR